MSKIPRIPTFDLKGIEAQIQKLQIVLGDNIPWLQYSFGVVVPHQKEVEGAIVTYPGGFVDNATDIIDLRPSDNYSAYSFWEYIDPAEVITPEGAEYSVKKYVDYEYNVSLIVWADVKRIDSGPYNEVKSKMRQDLINVFETGLIGTGVIFNVNQIFDRLADQIFLGYDLDNTENNIKWPFVGFRINGVIRFNRECPVDNSYSVT